MATWISWLGGLCFGHYVILPLLQPSTSFVDMGYRVQPHQLPLTIHNHFTDSSPIGLHAVSRHRSSDIGGRHPSSTEISEARTLTFLLNMRFVIVCVDLKHQFEKTLARATVILRRSGATNTNTHVLCVNWCSLPKSAGSLNMKFEFSFMSVGC